MSYQTFTIIFMFLFSLAAVLIIFEDKFLALEKKLNEEKTKKSKEASKEKAPKKKTPLKTSNGKCKVYNYSDFAA